MRSFVMQSNLLILKSYQKQFKDIAPLLSAAKLHRALKPKYSSSTIYRALNQRNTGKNLPLNFLVDLERLGILKTPLIIEGK